MPAFEHAREMGAREPLLNQASCGSQGADHGQKHHPDTGIPLDQQTHQQANPKNCQIDTHGYETQTCRGSEIVGKIQLTTNALIQKRLSP